MAACTPSVPYSLQRLRIAPSETQAPQNLIQTSALPHRTPQVKPGLAAGVHSMQGGGQPLPAAERAFFEPRFGADFSAVRLHRDEPAAATARSLDARAYTLGKNVVMGASAPAPGTLEGRELLAHELTHVVQQGRAASGVTPFVIQRYPCQATDHDTSLEHRLIEVDYTNHVNPNAGREYEVPEGSVELREKKSPDDPDRHKTGYIDLVDMAAREIYDIKRDEEPYPAVQLNQYLTAANRSCHQEKDWTLGRAYPASRTIAFDETTNLIALQRRQPGVISYSKVPRTQRGIASFLAPLQEGIETEGTRGTKRKAEPAEKEQEKKKEQEKEEETARSSKKQKTPRAPAGGTNKTSRPTVRQSPITEFFGSRKRKAEAEPGAKEKEQGSHVDASGKNKKLKPDEEDKP